MGEAAEKKRRTGRGKIRVYLFVFFLLLRTRNYRHSNIYYIPREIHPTSDLINRGDGGGQMNSTRALATPWETIEHRHRVLARNQYTIDSVARRTRREKCHEYAHNVS